MVNYSGGTGKKPQAFTANTDVDTRLPAFEVSNAPAAAFKGLAGQLSSLAGEAGQWADAAAKAEGERDGSIAGTTEGYQPTRANTIYGAAFDASGNRALALQVEMRARQELMQAAVAFGDNPAEMQAATAKINQKYVGAINRAVPELAGDIGATIQRAGDGYTFAAAKEHRAKVEREDKENFGINLSGQLGDIARLAVAGSGDPKLGARLEGELSRVDGQIDARADLSPQQKQRMKAAARSTAVGGLIEGQIGDIQDMAALDAFGNRMKDEWTQKKGLLGKLDPDQFQAAQNAVERRRAELTRVVAGQQRQLNGTLQEIEGVVLRGEAIGPQALANATVRLAQADPSGEMAARLQELQGLHEWGRTFRSVTPREQAATLASMDERATRTGLNPIEEKRRTLARNVLADRAKDDARDILGTANKNFGVAIADIDFSAADFPQQARRRTVEAEQFAKERGIQPIYLKAADREQLKKAMEQDPAAALQFGQKIMAGFGTERAPRVLKEISEDLPQLAFALRPNNPNLANAWLVSEQIERSGQKLPAVKLDQVRDTMRTMGLDQLFQGREIEMAKMADAARPLVGARLGVNAGKFEPTDSKHRAVMADVLNELVGRQRDIRTGKELAGPVKFNGFTTLAPSNIATNDFPALVRTLVDGDLAAAGIKAVDAAGRPLPIGDLQGARWVPVGRDRYRIALDGKLAGPNPWIGGGDGKPLEIDLSPASPLINRLRERAPRLFR
jgi:hypothetical protein